MMLEACFRDLKQTTSKYVFLKSIQPIILSSFLYLARNNPLGFLRQINPIMKARTARKINELITPVEFYHLHQNCTKKWQRDDPAPIYGEQETKTPTGGGKKVGGTGLEPATSSV
jgi:hypothetical protein